MSEVTKKFADNLGDLISESKLNMQELAKEIGISSGALSKYQNDAAAPGIDALVKISNYFDVSSDWLLGLTDVKTPETNLRAVCDFTGLSEDAVEFLRYTYKQLHGIILNEKYKKILENGQDNNFSMATDIIDSQYEKFCKLYGTTNKEDLIAQLVDDFMKEDNRVLTGSSMFEAKLIIEILDLLLSKEKQTNILLNLASYVFGGTNNAQSGKRMAVVLESQEDDGIGTLLNADLAQFSGIFLLEVENEIQKLRDSHKKYYISDIEHEYD